MQAFADSVDIDEMVAEVSQYIAEANIAAKQSQSNNGGDDDNPDETDLAFIHQRSSELT